MKRSTRICHIPKLQIIYIYTMRILKSNRGILTNGVWKHICDEESRFTDPANMDATIRI